MAAIGEVEFNLDNDPYEGTAAGIVELITQIAKSEGMNVCSLRGTVAGALIAAMADDGHPACALGTAIEAMTAIKPPTKGVSH